MILVFLEALLAAAGCYGVWRLWLTTKDRGPGSPIVAWGFLIRAVASQVLFWVSWLHLPLACSLQLGDGFWFFAPDGRDYLTYARELVAQGPAAILRVDEVYASHVYQQVLAVVVALFGPVTSSSILLNCAAYLGTCRVMQYVATRGEVARTPRTLALAAVALGPGTILFSLQPLKDAFFWFLVVAAAGLFFWWQGLWRAETMRWRGVAGCAMALVVVVYAIAGTRWYFAAFICAAAIPFFFAAAPRTSRRGLSLLASAFLFVLCVQAFRFGGGGDIPPAIGRFIGTGSEARLRKSFDINDVRAGFESVPAATKIIPGPALESFQSGDEPKPIAGPRRRKGPHELPAVPSMMKHPAPPLKWSPAVFIAGFAATFLPRWLGQATGVVRIGGGRGLWVFAEVDTLIFDAVIVVAIAWSIRARRAGGRITPLFIFVAVLLVLAVPPMVYAVANFGTLFRLRQILYLLCALIPVTLHTR